MVCILKGDAPGYTPDTGCFVIQREIVLNKRPGEAFGIKLNLVCRRAIITSVREEEVGGIPCPATRCGLNVGDEIVSVNGALVNNVAAVAHALENLHHCKQLKLCIREMPFFRLHTLRRHSNSSVGLTLEKGIITAVAEGSPASMADIKPGRAVVAINGEVVVAKQDSHIRSLIERGWAIENNELVITTMAERKYREFHDAVLQMPAAQRPSITSVNSNVVLSPPTSRKRLSLAPPLSPSPTSSSPRTRRSEPFTNFFSFPPAERSASIPAASSTTTPPNSPLSRQDSLSSSVFRRFSSLDPLTSSPKSPRALIRSTFRSITIRTHS